jgi:hypothetical protein
MNAPKPCNTCSHLCNGAWPKNDPNYLEECRLGYDLGNYSCPSYRRCKKHRDNRRRAVRDAKNRELY